MRITLVGSSGFLGRHVVAALAGAGHACTVISRVPSQRRPIRDIPYVRLVQADPYDQGALAREADGADVLVSMAGILNEKGRDGSGFRRTHVELVENIVAAAHEAGVERLLHVSALNAGKGESHYLASKGEGEQLVRDSGIDAAVFQPSVIFGAGDSFFNRFAGLLKFAPFMPLACPEARMQPVFAGDVAAAMLAVLEQGMAGAQTFELGGPHVYSLRELVRLAGVFSDHQRAIVGLPDGLAKLQASLMEWVPGKPFSMDNFRSLQTDNVTVRNALPALGIRPTAIEAVVPDYLGKSSHQKRLDASRRSAPWRE